MSAEGILGHELIGDATCQILVDTSLDVDLRQLFLFEWEVVAQLRGLACKVSLFGNSTHKNTLSGKVHGK